MAVSSHTLPALHQQTAQVAGLGDVVEPRTIYPTNAYKSNGAHHTRKTYGVTHDILPVVRLQMYTTTYRAAQRDETINPLFLTGSGYLLQLI